MKEMQKIYIRGCKDKKQGKRVIEELERRGGINRLFLKGNGHDWLYYIQPNGEINCLYDVEGTVADLVKEYYTEVKVNDVKNKWPKKGGSFFTVGRDLTWDMMQNKGDALSKSVIKSGNCFHSLSEADEVARMFREFLKSYKQFKKTEDGKGKKV